MNQGSCPGQLTNAVNNTRSIQEYLTDFSNRLTSTEPGNEGVLTQIQSSLVYGEDQQSKEMREELYRPMLNSSYVSMLSYFSIIIIWTIAMFLFSDIAVYKKTSIGYGHTDITSERIVIFLSVIFLGGIIATLLSIFQFVLIKFLTECLEYDKTTGHTQEECNEIYYKRNICNYIIMFLFFPTVITLGLLAFSLCISIFSMFIYILSNPDSFDKSQFGRRKRRNRSKFGVSKDMQTIKGLWDEWQAVPKDLDWTEYEKQTNVFRNQIIELTKYTKMDKSIFGSSFTLSIILIIMGIGSSLIGPSVAVGNSRLFKVLKEESVNYCKQNGLMT